MIRHVFFFSSLVLDASAMSLPPVMHDHTDISEKTLPGLYQRNRSFSGICLSEGDS